MGIRDYVRLLRERVAPITAGVGRGYCEEKKDRYEDDDDSDKGGMTDLRDANVIGVDVARGVEILGRLDYGNSGSRGEGFGGSFGNDGILQVGNGDDGNVQIRRSEDEREGERLGEDFDVQGKESNTVMQKSPQAVSPMFGEGAGYDREKVAKVAEGLCWRGRRREVGATRTRGTSRDREVENEGDIRQRLLAVAEKARRGRNAGLDDDSVHEDGGSGLAFGDGVGSRERRARRIDRARVSRGMFETHVEKDEARGAEGGRFLVGGVDYFRDPVRDGMVDGANPRDGEISENGGIPKMRRERSWRKLRRKSGEWGRKLIRQKPTGDMGGDEETAENDGEEREQKEKSWRRLRRKSGEWIRRASFNRQRSAPNIHDVETSSDDDGGEEIWGEGDSVDAVGVQRRTLRRENSWTRLRRKSGEWFGKIKHKSRSAAHRVGREWDDGNDEGYGVVGGRSLTVLESRMSNPGNCAIGRLVEPCQTNEGDTEGFGNENVDEERRQSPIAFKTGFRGSNSLEECRRGQGIYCERLRADALIPGWNEDQGKGHTSMGGLSANGGNRRSMKLVQRGGTVSHSSFKSLEQQEKFGQSWDQEVRLPESKSSTGEGESMRNVPCEAGAGKHHQNDALREKYIAVGGSGGFPAGVRGNHASTRAPHSEMQDKGPDTGLPERERGKFSVIGEGESCRETELFRDAELVWDAETQGGDASRSVMQKATLAGKPESRVEGAIIEATVSNIQNSSHEEIIHREKRGGREETIEYVGVTGGEQLVEEVEELHCNGEADQDSALQGEGKHPGAFGGFRRWSVLAQHGPRVSTQELENYKREQPRGGGQLKGLLYKPHSKDDERISPRIRAEDEGKAHKREVVLHSMSELDASTNAGNEESDFSRERLSPLFRLSGGVPWVDTKTRKFSTEEEAQLTRRKDEDLSRQKIPEYARGNSANKDGKYESDDEPNTSGGSRRESALLLKEDDTNILDHASESTENRSSGRVSLQSADDYRDNFVKQNILQSDEGSHCRKGPLLHLFRQSKDRPDDDSVAGSDASFRGRSLQRASLGSRSSEDGAENRSDARHQALDQPKALAEGAHDLAAKSDTSSRTPSWRRISFYSRSKKRAGGIEKDEENDELSKSSSYGMSRSRFFRKLRGADSDRTEGRNRPSVEANEVVWGDRRISENSTESTGKSKGGLRARLKAFKEMLTGDGKERESDEEDAGGRTSDKLRRIRDRVKDKMYSETNTVVAVPDHPITEIEDTALEVRRGLGGIGDEEEKIEIGGEAVGPVRVNDGCVSFDVPDRWTAVRLDEGFALTKDRAMGFVCGVRSKDVSRVLMETERLALPAMVNVGSSPVFMSKHVVGVNYHCYGYASRAIARYERGFERGATLIALAFPVESGGHKSLVEMEIKLMQSICIICEPPDTAAGSEPHRNAKSPHMQQTSYTDSRGCLLQ